MHAAKVTGSAHDTLLAFHLAVRVDMAEHQTVLLFLRVSKLGIIHRRILRVQNLKTHLDAPNVAGAQGFRGFLVSVEKQE